MYMVHLFPAFTFRAAVNIPVISSACTFICRDFVSNTAINFARGRYLSNSVLFFFTSEQIRVAQIYAWFLTAIKCN